MINSGLLCGLVVVDCSLWLPGRLCSSNLASLGAEVTSVLPPTGDPMARHNPGLCQWLDIGKAQVSIDLMSNVGRQTFRELLPSGAVVIEGYRKETALRLGLSHDQLRECCADVIVCSLPAFRSASPQAHLPAHDLQIQAFAGLLSTEDPKKPAFAAADVATAMVATIGLAAAMTSRALSGRGCQLEVPMADAASYWSQVMRATKPSSSATSDIFVARDGLAFTLAILGEKQHEQLRHAINSVTEYDGELQQADLVRLFDRADRQQWLDNLSAFGLAVAPLHSVAEALGHQYFSEKYHETGGQLVLPVTVQQEALW